MAPDNILEAKEEATLENLERRIKTEGIEVVAHNLTPEEASVLSSVSDDFIEESEDDSDEDDKEPVYQVSVVIPEELSVVNPFDHPTKWKIRIGE